MLCKECGERIEEGSSFCVHCGKPVDPAEAGAIESDDATVPSDAIAEEDLEVSVDDPTTGLDQGISPSDPEPADEGDRTEDGSEAVDADADDGSVTPDAPGGEEPLEAEGATDEEETVEIAESADGPDSSGLDVLVSDSQVVSSQTLASNDTTSPIPMDTSRDIASGAAAQPMPVSYPGVPGTAPGPLPQDPTMTMGGMAAAVPQGSYQGTAAAAGQPQGGMGKNGIVILVSCIGAVVVIAIMVVVLSILGAGEPGMKLDGKVVTDPSAFVQGAQGSSSASTGSTAQGQSAASTDATQASADYIIPDSNTCMLSAEELNGMSNWDLYLARNEIYARVGRGFNNDDLKQYFGSKGWYSVKYSPQEFDSYPEDYFLNDVELANAKLMLSIEQSRNSPYV